MVSTQGGLDDCSQMNQVHAILSFKNTFNVQLTYVVTLVTLSVLYIIKHNNKCLQDQGVAIFA